MGAAHDFLHVVKEGRSFSGRERHCCFLNLGNGQFADVSAISGLDWDDDGRGAALVDWDHDGDLDIWLSNRNAPQVRFLLNQSPTNRHFVAVSLQGTRCNRDAVGARVEVFPQSDSAPPIQRSLRAGDGFLAQSSKRLLFGLGDASRLERIVVRWPGGKAETFAVSEVDRHYHLVEGRGVAQQVEYGRRVEDLAGGHLELPPETGTTRALCFSMIRLPITEYRSFLDERSQVVDGDDRLVLVNLWASWCQPCLTELQDFAANEQQLRARGIDVVALSVDDVTSNDATPGADHRSLQQIAFPFRSGRADQATIEKLQLLTDTIFELQAPLPIPASFLIDKRSRVVAMYKGPVSADQLLADAAQLRVRTTDEWRAATLPFAGQWEMPPRQRHLFNFVEELANRGYFRESSMYVKENQQMLTTHPRWHELSSKITAGLKEQ